MWFKFFFALPLIILTPPARAVAQGGPVPKVQIQTDSSLNHASSKSTTVTLYCGPLKDRPNKPLFVVDGKVSSEQDITSLNPDEIDNIVVLKRDAAANLFHGQAKNGVLIITTKHTHKKHLAPRINEESRPD